MSKKSGRKKFPKSVGGVPVPKELRKPGAKIMAAATSPVGLELIAAGLSMAAAAATAAVERERVKRRAEMEMGGDAVREARQAPNSPRGIQSPQPSNDPHEVGVALGRMAEAALAGLFRQKS